MMQNSPSPTDMVCDRDRWDGDYVTEPFYMYYFPVESFDVGRSSVVEITDVPVLCIVVGVKLRGIPYNRSSVGTRRSGY